MENIKQQPSDHELQQMIPAMLQRIKQLQSETGWKQSQQQSCQTFYKEEKDRFFVKGSKSIQSSIDKIVQFIQNEDNSHKINELSIQQKILHKYQNKFKIVYNEIKLQWPWDNRCTLSLFTKQKQNNNKIYLLYKSINFSYHQSSNAVTTQCQIQGFILQKIDDKTTKITIITDIDFKGWIPYSIKKQLSIKRVQIPAKIQQKINQQPNQNKQISDEYQKMLPVMLNSLKALQNQTNWQKDEVKPCETFFRQQGDKIIVKGSKIIPFSIDQILEFMGDDNNFMKINQMAIEHKVLKKNLNKYKIVYTQMKLPWPMDNRQTIMLFSRHIQNADKAYLINKTVEYPYPQTKGIIRAQNNIGGFVLQKIQQKQTKLTTYGNFDPKGSIPTMIKKQVSKKRAQAPIKIQEKMKKHYKK